MAIRGGSAVSELAESPFDLIRFHVERLEDYARVASLTDLVWAYVQALDLERPEMREPDVLRDTLSFAIALRRRMDEIEIEATSREVRFATS